MSVLRDSRKTRITRNYASGIKRRDSQANRAAFARHIERKRKAFFSCHCEARSAAAIPQIKYVILSAAKYLTELSLYSLSLRGTKCRGNPPKKNGKYAP